MQTDLHCPVVSGAMGRPEFQLITGINIFYAFRGNMEYEERRIPEELGCIKYA